MAFLSPYDASTLVYTPSNNAFVDDLMQKVCDVLSLPRPESVDNEKTLEGKMMTNTTYFAGIVFDIQVVINHFHIIDMQIKF